MQKLIDMDLAVAAYRNGYSREAILLLVPIVQEDAQNWRAHLYLGMAYCQAHQVSEARSILKHVVEDCQDPELAKQAFAVLLSMKRDWSGDSAMDRAGNKPAKIRSYH